MRKKFVSLLLICSLTLTACTNSGGEDTTLTETTYAPSEATTQTESSETIAESETEAENAPLEFTGIEISDEALGNFSIRGSSAGGYHVFCYSDDMVYFSDINKGWRLYSYDGEKASLILDKQAYYLYYYDNCIYFLSGRSVDALTCEPNGILYKFDIESNEVTKLTDEIVHLPRADETGIYYSKEYEDKFYIYRLDEESGKDERLYEGYAYYRIGDYEISRKVIGKKGEDEVYDYYLLKGDEKICFLSGTTVCYDFIQDGIFYYKDWDFVLHTIDLRTGENNILPIDYSFTILDDEIYYYDYDRVGVPCLFRWQNGEPELMFTIGLDLPFDTGYRGNYEDHDISGYIIYTIKGVMNDGKSLYVYVYPPNGVYKETHLGKIEPLDDGSGDYVLTMID